MEEFLTTKEGRKRIGLVLDGGEREGHDPVLFYIAQFEPVTFEGIDYDYIGIPPTQLRSSLLKLFEAGLITKVER